MGFGLSDLLYTNPVTAAPYGAYKTLYNNPAAPPGQTDPRNTFVPYSGQNGGATELSNSLFNTEAARGYGGTFDQAYQNLGQPLHDNNRDDVYVGGTRALANSFADQYLKKNGRLPSSDEVKTFVGQNLTPSFASKFILGMAPDQITANYTDPYIQANPASSGSTGDLNAVGTLQTLSSQLPGLYQNASNQLGEVADTAFAAPRKAAIEDEAALGRLRSPASIGNIGAVDAAKASSLASGRAGLLSQQIGNTTDLGKALSGVQQSQQQINNQASQFGQTNALSRTALNDQLYGNEIQRGQNQQLLNLSSLLGRQKASQNQPGPLDYINTGANALSAGGKIAALFA